MKNYTVTVGADSTGSMYTIGRQMHEGYDSLTGALMAAGWLALQHRAPGITRRRDRAVAIIADLGSAGPRRVYIADWLSTAGESLGA